MIALLRRLSPLLAMAMLTYMAHGALEGEPVSLADDGEDASEIVELLPFAMAGAGVRPADEKPIEVREPFGQKLRPRQYGSDDDDVEEGAYLAPPPVTTTRPFELRLDSVVDFGSGNGSARITGHTVDVGQRIPGLDPGCPPVLLAVEGPAVLIEHRGIHHLLDLRRKPSIFVPSLPLEFGLPGSEAGAEAEAGAGAGAEAEAGTEAETETETETGTEAGTETETDTDTDTVAPADALRSSAAVVDPFRTKTP